MTHQHRPFEFNPARFKRSQIEKSRPMPEDHPRLQGDSPVLKRLAYEAICAQANGWNTLTYHTPANWPLRDRAGRPIRLVISDGIQRAADTLGAYWILDIVQSALAHLPTEADDHMAVIEVTRLITGQQGTTVPDAELRIHEGNDQPGQPGRTWFRQWIPFTDLPMHTLKWYFLPAAAGEHTAVVCLPTER